MSGDNFEEFADQFNISNYEKFSKKPGEFFGREINNFNQLKPCGMNILIINPINECSFTDSEINIDENFVTIDVEDDFGIIQFTYSIIETVDEQKCLNLSPNINGKCLSSYLVEVGDYSGVNGLGYDLWNLWII